jgi:hypothetical protein
MRLDRRRCHGGVGHLGDLSGDARTLHPMVKEPAERRLRRGQPFMTRDLMDKRRLQREELRLVADDDLRRAVEDMGAPPKDPLPVEDRALIESELRDYADSLRNEGGLARILERRAPWRQAEVLGRWANGIQAQSNTPLAQVRHYFTDQQRIAEQTAAQHSEANDRDDDEALLKYIVALVLADEAAWDGSAPRYHDPRAN